ncbi:MAG: hypothetical protein K8R88_11470 [Armatimonadetes bacterium]|nr:hypothetical protein [Armatimonadota bacterium]
MADPADVAATKLLRSQLAKFGIDATKADLRVSHGTAYIRGALSAIRGSESANSGDLRDVVQNALKGIRGKPGIKEVIVEASYRS